MIRRGKRSPKLEDNPAFLRVLRFMGAVAMLCVVVAGSLGYGDQVKLIGAGAGASVALVIWKLGHLAI